MLLICRHASGEGPGYLAEFLDRHAIPYRVVKVDKQEPLPPSIAEFSGLVFMGGPMSVNDPLPWIPQALSLIQQAVQAKRPVLGHCLGGQLISKALGGQVKSNLQREIGWFPVQTEDTLEARAWLEGLPAEFEAFHWHAETFTIPIGATRILKSAACANQAFVAGKTLALQCHVEMTAALVHAWVKSASELKHPDGSVQSREQILEDLPQRIVRLQRIADVLYSRWIEGLSA